MSAASITPKAVIVSSRYRWYAHQDVRKAIYYFPCRINVLLQAVSQGANKNPNQEISVSIYGNILLSKYIVRKMCSE